MDIETHAWWYIVQKSFYIGEDDYAGLSLRPHKWDAMRYGKQQTTIVDYPGEYDIEWISIRCVEADGMLSYIVHLDNKQIAVLHNSAPLEKYSFDNIDVWLCLDDSIKDDVWRMEMEGEVRVLWADEE